MLESVTLTEEPKQHRRSASQLESYLRCPEAYRLEKVVKAPQYPAAWLTQGIAFHDAIEKWERTGRTFPIETVVEWFVTAWNEQLAKQMEQEPNLSVWLTGGRTKPENDIKNRFERGQQQVMDYIAWALATENEWRILDLGDHDLACEVEFDIQLQGVRVVGFIDQLIEWPNGTVTVRDLKTGTKLPPTARQLGIYKIAAKEVLDLDINWGDFYMSKNTAPTEPYDLSRFTPERVGRWFVNLDRSVMEGRFTPNPGDYCRICAVERFCDLLGRDAHLYPVESLFERQVA